MPPQTRYRESLIPSGAATPAAARLLRLSAPSEVVGSSAGAFEYLFVRRLQSCWCAVLLLAKMGFYTHIKAITDRHSVAEKFGVNVQRIWFVEDGRVVCSKNEL